MGPFHISPDEAASFQAMSDKEILNFAKLHENASSASGIERYIYTCFLIFKRTNSMSYLTRGIHSMEGLVEKIPYDDPENDRCCAIWDIMLVPVQLADQALKGMKDSFDDTLKRLCITDQDNPEALADALPFDIDPEVESLLHDLSDEEIEDFARVQEDAVQDADMELSVYTHLLVFDRTGSVDSLKRAIEHVEKWTGMRAGNHSHQAPDSRILDMLLHKYYRARRDSQPNDMTLASALSDLANRRGARFDHTESRDDLDRVIEVVFVIVNATFIYDDVGRAQQLYSLGYWLAKRAERTGSKSDLDQAIECSEMAVRVAPHAAERVSWLNHCAIWLGLRFEWTDSMDDLNRSVDVSEAVLDAAPPDNHNRPGWLNNLGLWLARRSERTGSVDDLARAINVTETALEAVDHPNRVEWSNGLAHLLSLRFKRTGALTDLNRAIEVANNAIKAIPMSYLHKSIVSNTLAHCLHMRYDRVGLLEDLDHAIKFARMAVDAAPIDHPVRPAVINCLTNGLHSRYERTNSVDDLNRAIQLGEKALESISPGHPYRVVTLQNLGISLLARCGMLKSMKDFDYAIEVHKTVVSETPLDHADRPTRLINLGTAFGTRYDQTKSIEDINGAVEASKEAVKDTPLDAPTRASFLHNLGYYLGRRFQQAESMEDLENCISFFEEGWNCQNAPPSVRIRLAQRAGCVFASLLLWKESSRLFEGAVKLLPTVSPRLLQHTDQQHVLAQSAEIASQAAATALNAGKEGGQVLQLLELSRAIMTGLLLDMRTDASDLERQHPELAQQFVLLRDELDSPPDTNPLPLTLDNSHAIEMRVQRRHEAEVRFHRLLDEIRAKPDFERFLLPFTMDELKAAAALGPIVVINASRYRCDAFLVRQNYPITVLELPKLHLEDIKAKTKSMKASLYDLQSVLEWLWDVAVCPILNALDFTQPPINDEWSRIWWIPTGKLSRLPFHAAGRHSEGSFDTVLDRVISSYSPSIKALIHGRRNREVRVHEQVTGNALLINVPGSGLPFAKDEVEMLANLCSSMELNPVKPASQRDEILKHMHECKIFHFASHGESNLLEPSQSCLVLDGGKSLTVADLRHSKLQDTAPFLAYLSACSTKVNEAEDLLDEEIHLVSAFQLAGFRHVVGTLWEVSDRHCVTIARVLYETIRDEGMTDKAVGRGLHRAVRTLRDQDMRTKRTKVVSQAPGRVEIREDGAVHRETLDQNESNRQCGEISSNIQKPDTLPYQRKSKGKHIESIIPRNRCHATDPGPDQQNTNGEPVGEEKSRQSYWGKTAQPTHLEARIGGPQIWAAYIHTGL